MRTCPDFPYIGRFWLKLNTEETTVKDPNLLRTGLPRLYRNAFLSQFWADINGSTCVILKKTFQSISLCNFFFLQKITFRIPMFYPKPHAPWYSDELCDAKHKRRQLERNWWSTKLEVHHQLYPDYQLHRCQQIIRLH